MKNKQTQSRKQGKNRQKQKGNTYESACALYEGRELILNVFRSGIFPIKEKKGKGLKILIPKQVLQILPIALALVKAGNTSENLLNEIRQIIHYLYQEKVIILKTYNEFNKCMIQKLILYL